jgi:hypothetical protein
MPWPALCAAVSRMRFSSERLARCSLCRAAGAEGRCGSARAARGAGGYRRVAGPAPASPRPVPALWPGTRPHFAHALPQQPPQRVSAHAHACSLALGGRRARTAARGGAARALGKPHSAAGARRRQRAHVPAAPATPKPSTERRADAALCPPHTHNRCPSWPA